MNVVKFTKLFGIVFVLIGVLGFVPVVTSDGYLLGIFEVDTVHNVVHLLTGVLALAAAKMGKSSLFLKVFGVVYALVTVLGFVMGGDILGLFHANMADNLLHLVVAAAALYFGFMGGKEETEPVAASAAPEERQQPQSQNPPAGGGAM